MIPSESVNTIYETIRVVAWRTARRFGLEPEDLAQDSYLTLSQIQIDEARSQGRSLHSAYRAMIPTVVDFTARKLSRREKNHRHSDLQEDQCAILETDQMANIEEDLFDSTQVAINKLRPIWKEQAIESREDGIDAWRAGRIQTAQRHAESAAMYSIIGSMVPERSAIPVMTYVFGHSADEVAAERSTSQYNVAQINSRFKRVVKEQSVMEFQLIKARGGNV